MGCSEVPHLELAMKRRRRTYAALYSYTAAPVRARIGPGNLTGAHCALRTARLLQVGEPVTGLKPPGLINVPQQYYNFIAWHLSAQVSVLGQEGALEEPEQNCRETWETFICGYGMMIP